jgi:hypothetical protein
MPTVLSRKICMNSKREHKRRSINDEGGIKDIFGVCGIEEAAVFDGVVGRVARRRLLPMNVY